MIPVPLGVRITCGNIASLTRFQEWFADAIEDITFRHVIPGGFASATIRLHRQTIVQTQGSYFYGVDDHTFKQLVRLFSRIEIIDTRNGMAVWEGRVEDPRRVDDSAWEVAALGSAVVASDIQRPMFYVDETMDGWVTQTYDYLQVQVDAEAHKIEARWAGGLTWPANTQYTAATYMRLRECGLYLGRYDLTLQGVAPAGTGNQAPTHLWNVMVLEGRELPSDEGDNGTMDATNYTQNLRRTRIVKKATSKFSSNAGFQEREARIIDYQTGVGGDGQAFGSYNSASDQVVGRLVRPRVQVQRLDIEGIPIQVESGYPNEYVTTQQIVTDVAGRFLVGGWMIGTEQVNVLDYVASGAMPFYGQCRSWDAYIDTAASAQFYHLAWFDGTTAEGILNEMMNSHPNNYWAIWESRIDARRIRSGQDWGADDGFRFEWATWPDSPGYLATTVDGFEPQPDGEAIYNALFYKWADESEFWQGFKYLEGQSAFFTDDGEYDETWINATPRAFTVIRDAQSNSTVVNADRDAQLDARRKITHVGSLTVKRPIYLYDEGVDNWTGAGRWVQPWEVRPGKLIRLMDILPRAALDQFTFGNVLSPREHEGTVFKVVGTEYNANDNACRLELDKVQTWDNSNQIVKSGQGAPSPGLIKVFSSNA